MDEGRTRQDRQSWEVLLGKGKGEKGRERKKERKEETERQREKKEEEAGKVLPFPSEEQPGKEKSGWSLSLKGAFAPACRLGSWASQATAWVHPAR